MTHVPEPVYRHLLTAAPGRRQPAWVRFGADGTVHELGGDLPAYGLDEVEIGEPVRAHAAWLEGFVPAPEAPLELPAIDVGSGVFADLHLWRRGEDCWLLAVDATDRVLERSSLLQPGNDLALLRERLEGAERGRVGARLERSEVLSSLGVELLERGVDGAFRSPSEPPKWLDELCEWEPGDERVLTADDPTSFLRNFILDATAFFALGEPGLLRSGIWIEPSGGDERVFEAIAIVLSTGRRVLIVERLDRRYEERRELLQRAREQTLSYEELRHQVQVKDVLLHCIVHDLKAPLSGMVGALSMMQSRELAPERQGELVALCLRQAERQEALIRHVLEVFSAEVDALERFEESALRAPDLMAVTFEVCERFRPAFQQRGLELIAPDRSESSSNGPLPVVGRTDRLERVLANLLENALRHAPKETAVEVTVERDDEEGPGAAILRVRDRGPGVPDEIRDQLFDRFVRGGARGAAGLGLYYCRMTVTRWGGDITYAPRAGGGAEFIVRLRRALRF